MFCKEYVFDFNATQAMIISDISEVFGLHKKSPKMRLIFSFLCKIDLAEMVNDFQSSLSSKSKITSFFIISEFI